MLVLGIESSCDDSSVAIYDSSNGKYIHNTRSQTKLHNPYGGVVPELASREHIRFIQPLLLDLLKKNGLILKDINAIGYTYGPGLIGSLMCGASFATSLAWAMKMPLIAVNHLEAHLLIAKLFNKNLKFPFTALLVSGGHTQLYQINAINEYQLLGNTLDDAAGEAIDKTAKLMNLNYPGGPEIERLAKYAKENEIEFSVPLKGKKDYNFSFSGLKTQVRYLIEKLKKDEELSQQQKANISFALQKAIFMSLIEKSIAATKKHSSKNLIISGGVSANLYLRKQLEAIGKTNSINIHFVPIKFCTDNALMVAYTAYQHISQAKKNTFTIEVNSKANFSQYMQYAR